MTDMHDFSYPELALRHTTGEGFSEEEKAWLSGYEGARMADFSAGLGGTCRPLHPPGDLSEELLPYWEAGREAWYSESTASAQMEAHPYE